MVVVAQGTPLSSPQIFHWMVILATQQSSDQPNHAFVWDFLPSSQLLRFCAQPASRGGGRGQYLGVCIAAFSFDVVFVSYLKSVSNCDPQYFWVVSCWKQCNILGETAKLWSLSQLSE